MKTLIFYFLLISFSCSLKSQNLEFSKINKMEDSYYQEIIGEANDHYFFLLSSTIPEQNVETMNRSKIAGKIKFHIVEKDKQGNLISDNYFEPSHRINKVLHLFIEDNKQDFTIIYYRLEDYPAEKILYSLYKETFALNGQKKSQMVFYELQDTLFFEKSENNNFFISMVNNKISIFNQQFSITNEISYNLKDIVKCCITDSGTLYVLTQEKDETIINKYTGSVLEKQLKLKKPEERYCPILKYDENTKEIIILSCLHYGKIKSELMGCCNYAFELIKLNETLNIVLDKTVILTTDMINHHSRKYNCHYCGYYEVYNSKDDVIILFERKDISSITYESSETSVNICDNVLLYRVSDKTEEKHILLKRWMGWHEPYENSFFPFVLTDNQKGLVYVMFYASQNGNLKKIMLDKDMKVISEAIEPAESFDGLLATTLKPYKVTDNKIVLPARSKKRSGFITISY